MAENRTHATEMASEHQTNHAIDRLLLRSETFRHLKLYQNLTGYSGYFVIIIKKKTEAQRLHKSIVHVKLQTDSKLV